MLLARPKNDISSCAHVIWKRCILCQLCFVHLCSIRTVSNRLYSVRIVYFVTESVFYGLRCRPSRCRASSGWRVAERRRFSVSDVCNRPKRRRYTDTHITAALQVAVQVGTAVVTNVGQEAYWVDPNAQQYGTYMPSDQYDMSAPGQGRASLSLAVGPGGVLQNALFLCRGLVILWLLRCGWRSR